MVTGRKPKPREVHLANGSYRINPKRENKRAPKPNKGRPTKPQVVKDDAIASTKWNQLCKEMETLGIMAKCDVDLLEMYCVLFAQYRSALASVRKTGLVLVTREDHGKTVEVKRNPFETVQNKTIAQLAKMMAELGLTPAARSRLAADPQEDDDPFMEYLNKRAGKG